MPTKHILLILQKNGFLCIVKVRNKQDWNDHCVPPLERSLLHPLIRCPYPCPLIHGDHLCICRSCSPPHPQHPYTGCLEGHHCCPLLVHPSMCSYQSILYLHPRFPHLHGICQRSWSYHPIQAFPQG